MPKFYIKSVVSTIVLTVLSLLILNLIKGIDLSILHRKMLVVPWITTLFFLVFNEKLTRSERWMKSHYVLLLLVFVMSVSFVYLLI